MDIPGMSYYSAGAHWGIAFDWHGCHFSAVSLFRMLQLACIYMLVLSLSATGSGAGMLVSIEVRGQESVACLFQYRDLM